MGVKYADGVMLVADTLGVCLPVAKFSTFLGHSPPPPPPLSPPFSCIRDHHHAGSYGSLARFTDLRRIRRVGDFTLIAASGEYSDFQVCCPEVFVYIDFVPA